MATLQIRLDDDLKEKAQAVAADMGLELSSAIRVFLAQMVKENGLPFRPANDPFYSAKNQEALQISLDELRSDNTVTRNLEELRSME